MLRGIQETQEICSSTPVLAYAYYSKQFKLHTDALTSGLGVVLYQEQDDSTMNELSPMQAEVCQKWKVATILPN